MAFLQGYKTYIVAALIGILTTIKQLGYIDQATFDWIMGILAAGGLATLRAGVTKSGPA